MKASAAPRHVVVVEGVQRQQPMANIGLLYVTRLFPPCFLVLFMCQASMCPPVKDTLHIQCEYVIGWIKPIFYRFKNKMFCS